MLHFQGRNISPKEGETVLEALLRVGADVPFSCKSGVCHRCMLKCTHGTPPEEATRRLPPYLAASGYMLACQCAAEIELTLEPRNALDIRTTCMLHEVQAEENGQWLCQFEPEREMVFEPGDTLELDDPTGSQGIFTIVNRSIDEPFIRAHFRPTAGHPLPAWLTADDAFGLELVCRGPVVQRSGSAQPPGEEQPTPEPDPQLWVEMNDGALARTALEAFYDKVYEDRFLAPFFEGVTKDRAIGKQYSFMKQCVTGVRDYMGDRPRNAHHWMVISNQLFDYRQSLMIQTLREHGMSEEQIQRWTRFEEHFRADMVKAAPWPRRLNGVDLPTETYAEEVLTVDTVCDYCESEILAGTRVRFHQRLGKLACAACAPQHAADLQADPAKA